MPRQPRSALGQLLKSVEADLDRLGLQAQLLRYLAHERPARRTLTAERSHRLESMRRTSRPGVSDC